MVDCRLLLVGFCDLWYVMVEVYWPIVWMVWLSGARGEGRGSNGFEELLADVGDDEDHGTQLLKALNGG